MTTTWIEKIKQFNEGAGTELNRQQLLPAEAFNEVAMLFEELQELELAMVQGKIKVGDQLVPIVTLREQRIEIADAIGDIITVAVGTAQKLGIDLDAVMNEIADSNLSKAENGTFLKDPNGKIQKGKNYQKPQLAKVVK